MSCGSLIGVKKGLSAAGATIYFLVMAAAVVVDLAIQVALVVDKTFGWAVAYLLFGWPITLTVAHWVALLLVSPFAIAVGHMDTREVSSQDETPVVQRRVQDRRRAR